MDRNSLIVVRDEQFCMPVLRLNGCLRDRTWDEFEDALCQLREEGHQVVGLDLSEVCHMSPLGARLLRDARKRFAAQFRTLTITALSPAVILAMGS